MSATRRAEPLAPPLDRRSRLGRGRARLGRVRCLVDAHLWPSRVWGRLHAESDERLARYSRGEGE